MSDDSRVIDPVTQVELLVPAYGTPERAIRRAALRRDGLLRAIQFYPDWPHPWPLWDESGEVSAEDLGLSDALREDLRRWGDEWNTTYRYDTGWPSVAARDVWMNEGDALAERVQREVWDIADVRAEHRGFQEFRP
ncbi:hypothetical protein [Cryobacterium sp. SO1]|uniref:hypothetical protein n=1 Tax=Cryobacterium sp. SO1 TaxID=1897061 RepID=UPI001022B145|nr:hypothetical protein [Cryobacterium sp. SO1]